jgi:UDP-glucose 4-epimerase
MKNILITGAGPNGFIGRNISERFEVHYSVFTPSSLELDLCSFEAVKDFIIGNNIDFVIHAATYTKRSDNADIELEANLKMFYNLEFFCDRFEKLIYFGSGAEYDKRFDIDMATECEIGLRMPVSSYGLGKYIMNKAARASKNIYNLRLFGVYGKYENWRTTFISNLCCKVVFDLPLSIRQNCTFDFLYINDLVRIVEWFMSHTPQYHDYNICSARPVELTEIADTVLKISGKKLDISLLHGGRNLMYTASNTRLAAEYPQFMPLGLSDGIRDLYSWYEQHREYIDRDILAQTK